MKYLEGFLQIMNIHKWQIEIRLYAYFLVAIRSEVVKYFGGKVLSHKKEEDAIGLRVHEKFPNNVANMRTIKTYFWWYDGSLH